MAEFLNTDGINRKLTEIIASAKKELVFISPYLSLSNFLIENITQASRSGVVIKLMYGKGELKAGERKTLKNIPKMDIYFHSDLHAKCYYNERQMLITSMNLYEYSQKNNKEMGIVIDRLSDQEMFENALAETGRLFKQSKLKTLSNIPELKEDPEMKVAILFAPDQIPGGNCIRCGIELIHNPQKPLCTDCYTVWVRREDANQKERFCHTCGHEEDISMRRPQCYSCYSKSNKKRNYKH